MYKLASFCLLFIGLLNPLLSLPVTDSREMSPQLSAPDDEARLTLDELERASLLQILPEMLSAKKGGLENADPTTNTFNPRGSMRKFQDVSEQDPKVLLSHLLARTRKQYKQHETPAECFWKYCV
ncbi:urotensin-2 [Trichechus manatus latirostris]|uniref:Urotensin-2 n=1 Tax=Trichechus manatus latirostris TaxID=127582 RepID=A0A2Y9E2X1_TRIMA|nr:urotensin-2 [Trichechus manatus latirostris]